MNENTEFKESLNDVYHQIWTALTLKGGNLYDKVKTIQTLAKQNNIVRTFELVFQYHQDREIATGFVETPENDNTFPLYRRGTDTKSIFCEIYNKYRYGDDGSLNNIKIITFPDIVSIRRTMITEWNCHNFSDMVINDPNNHKDKEEAYLIHPQISPHINIIFGPDYFAIWSFKHYPNYTNQEEFNHHLDNIAQRVNHIVSSLIRLQKQGHLKHNEAIINIIEKKYLDIGVYIKILPYKMKKGHLIDF